MISLLQNDYLSRSTTQFYCALCGLTQKISLRDSIQEEWTRFQKGHELNSWAHKNLPAPIDTPQRA